MPEPTPHPLNAPGDYFVEDGCCMSCNVPFEFAADLFAWENEPSDRPGHCYVKAQPRTPDEHDRMFEVIRHAEADCICYRGGDRAIQGRLVEAGLGVVCVALPPDLQERSDQVLATMTQGRWEEFSGLLRRFWDWLRGRHGV